MTKSGIAVVAIFGLLIVGGIGATWYHASHAAPPTPPASPYVSLPQAMNADPGGRPLQPSTYITVTADTNCSNVSWLVTDPNIQLFPPSLLKDSKTAVVVAAVPGNYVVYAWSGSCAGGTPPSQCTLTIGTPPTPPVPPIPPTPPVPPAPSEPTDTLWPALKFAWQQESAIAKGKVGALSSLFKMAIPIANDPKMLTMRDLFDTIHTARSNLIGTDLGQIWTVMKGDLNSLLPTDPNQKLTADNRAQVSAAFARMSGLLDALGNLK